MRATGLGDAGNRLSGCRSIIALRQIAERHDTDQRLSRLITGRRRAPGDQDRSSAHRQWRLLGQRLGCLGCIDTTGIGRMPA
jgi:hypothetical protein